MLCLLVCGALVPPEILAAQLTFAWDYDASGAAGFALYCGPAIDDYPIRADVGNTTTGAITGLAEGSTYYCAVTAYDAATVESAYSNVVSASIPYAAPIINFAASPSTGTAPLNVAFTNTTTGIVNTWAWDFGDGTTSTAPTPTHVYSQPGSYTVSLTATGPGGSVTKGSATAIAVSAPTPAAPTPNFTASPTSGTAPLSVAFTNTTTGTVNTWAWNFGDGTTSTAQTPTHVYSQPGSYTVSLTATGPGGSVTKGSATAIAVSAPTPAAPTPNFTASPTSGTAPLSVAFTNTTTGTVNTWAWDFGDGTTSTAPTPTHVYSTTGSYKVVLTATGPGGTVSKTAVTAITVSAPATQSAYTLWATTAKPVNANELDDAAVNLGVKFTSSQNGYITGIRFYKSKANTGTHVGALWSSTGQKLAQATFTSETASGWQQVNFATPVAITANTVYVASYFAPKGHYANDDNYFATAGVDKGPLHALRNGASGANGVYAYSSSAAFPSSSYKATNYWVDVVFKLTK